MNFFVSIQTIVLAIYVLGSISALARAADAVRTDAGTITGQIERISADEVVVKTAAGDRQTVPASAIRSVRFENEPSKLASVRAALAAGRLDDAQKALAELSSEGIAREAIVAEIEFYQAEVAGRAALAGLGNLRDAGRLAQSFAQKRGDSFHYYTAVELVGDLLTALGSYNNALGEYTKIEKSGRPDMKLRSAIARARVLRAQGKFEEALTAYDAALALPVANDDGEISLARLAAELGKAECLADSARTDDGVALARQVLGRAGPDQPQLAAQGYNTLGNCLKKAGRSKEALLAYLHVELIYNIDPALEANALKNLVELWNTLGQPQRAAETLRRLNEKFPSAPATVTNPGG